jgi:hypothetical protein
MSEQSTVEITAKRVEELLSDSPAFAKVEDNFYVVRQGSAYVYVRVLGWDPDKALVRLVAQLAGGVEMTPELAIRLLRINTRMRFGAFGYVAKGSCIILTHTLLGGETLDADELLSAVRTVAVLADEYDDHIVEEAGGMRMQDLVDDSTTAAMLEDMNAPQSWDG